MDERIERLAQLLVENGLKSAFGVTGSGLSLDLITALEGRGVRYYPASHEAAAALMAGVVSRVSGEVSVSISIKGPGLANMLPGIVFNHFEGNPALSISEAYGAEVPAYCKHKRLDHEALLSSVVKGIISLSDVEHALGNLLQVARQEVPGPVHLDLCLRDRLTTSSGTVNEKPLHHEEKAYRELFKYFKMSQRPILIVGSLASRRSWAQWLEKLHIPVLTTVAAKGVLDERLDYSAGVFTGAGKELAPESQLLVQADLVVGLGLRNTEVLQPKPFGRPLIIVDEVDGGLAEGFGADVAVVTADTKLVFDILAELEAKSWGAESIQVLRDRLRSHLLTGDWLPAACFEVLNQLDFLHALVLDTGSFCTVGEHLWRAGPERYFVGSSNGRYMGTAIPLAIGLAICRPDLPVFCVVGDGGMRTYPAEIKLTVEEKLPVCFILMTDGHYGSVACASRSGSMSSRAVTVFGPSWWKSVEAMGCEAYPAEDRESFATIVQAWNRKGPLFIETTFDPKLYARMTERLR